jgi:hypothetical protein
MGEIMYKSVFALSLAAVLFSSFNSNAQNISKDFSPKEMRFRTYEDPYYRVLLTPLNKTASDGANAYVILNAQSESDEYISSITLSKCTEKNTGEINCVIVANPSRKGYAVERIDMAPGKTIKITHVDGYIQYVHIDEK